MTGEIERCSCEEALALRAELGAASLELRKLADDRDLLLHRTTAEQRVLDAARRFLESWEEQEAFPDQDLLPEEYALYLAAADLRALRDEAELACREAPSS